MPGTSILFWNSYIQIDITARRINPMEDKTVLYDVRYLFFLRFIPQLTLCGWGNRGVCFLVNTNFGFSSEANRSRILFLPPPLAFLQIKSHHSLPILTVPLTGDIKLVCI